MVFAASPSFSTDPIYQIDTWGVDEGLPENSATAMAQTHDGYLWFGTFNGLVRFDGVKFRVFNPVNTPELASDGIVNLHCDRSGRLWVSTYGALVVLDGGQWRQMMKIDAGSADIARTITERSNGDLLITTFNGRIFEFASGQLKQLSSPPGEPGRGYLGGTDEEGHWWVAQHRFIGRWNHGHWEKMISPPEPLPEAVSCGPARDGGIWILLGCELRKYRHGAEVTRQVLTEAPGGVWSMSEDSRGHVWIATYDQGFFRIAPDGAIKRWNSASGISNHGRFILEDREGNLWAGTSGDGLMRFKMRRFFNYGLEDGLKESVVKSVSPNADGIWAGTYGQGVFRLSDSDITHLQFEGTTNREFYVQSLLMDRSNRLWVGTYGNSLWRFDQQDSLHFPGDQTGGHNILAIFEDSRGGIWMSGGGGIAAFNDNEFRGWNGDHGLPIKSVTAFAEDAAGAIWVSNGSGVFRQEQQRFVEIRTEENLPLRGIRCLSTDRNGSLWLGSSEAALLRWRKDRLNRLPREHQLPIQSIYSIIEDEQGFFWLTSELGILRARAANLHAAMDGRTNPVPYQLFDADDGMAPAEFSVDRQPVCARDARGRLWFATSKGVTMTDPAKLELNEIIPPIHIEELVYHVPSSGADQGTLLSDVARISNSGNTTEISLRPPAGLSQELSLPAGSRWIEIRYSALSFASPKKVRFQVKIDGDSTDWHDVGNRRTVYLDQLQPGKHLFQVRGANNDNLWNETGATLAFTIEPFLWQTLWFRVTGVSLVVLSTMLAVALVALAKRRRDLVDLERTRHQQAELAHLSRVTMLGELSGSLAHELNQPLTSILSNAQAAQRFLAQGNVDLDEIRAIVKDIVDEDRRAGEVIHRLRQLFKKGAVQYQALDINEVIHEVLKLMRSDLINQGVTLQIELATELPPVKGDRVQIQQVLLNLMVNACDAMNGNSPTQADRQLNVRTDRAGREIRVSISDVGSGIVPDNLAHIFQPFYTTKAHGLGLGLSVCRTIIIAHDGKLWAENNAERGASFHFNLPATEDKAAPATP